MSSSLNRIKKNIIKAMQSANNQGTSAYDSVAEVRRVEGDTAWVHIAGGVDETPVKLTIAAKVGDTVQVRVGGGRAWITGNASAPPTDDHLANTANTTAKTANVTANQALQGANTAQNTADKAQSSADKAHNTATEAKTEITEQKQHFYHDEEGAHVCEATNGRFRADLKGSGLYIMDLNSGKASAIFGARRCIIGGGAEDNNMQITEDSVSINNGTYPLVNIKAEKTFAEAFRETLEFDGPTAEDTMLNNDRMFKTSYTLQHAPKKIIKVKLTGHNESIPLDLNHPLYGYTVDGNQLNIYADGNYGETLSYYWNLMDTLTIVYVLSDVIGTIDADVMCLTRELSFARGGDVTYWDGHNNVCGLIEITRGDGTATATTGTVTSQPRWWRCGNLVQLEFTIAATGTVAPGKNIAEGTITGIPRPVTLNGVRSVSYYGNNPNVIFLSQTGNFTARNCGNDNLASRNNAIGSYTYITDGYML